MKPLLTALALVLMATGASADVRLVVRADGTRVIVNDGRTRSNEGLKLSTLEWLAKQRDRKSEFDPIIERHAARYGVDPTLVRAVILVESNFDPNCVSNKGARGLMQLMPGTAKRFQVTEIHDPDQNIRGGVAYLAFLLDLHPGDLTRVLASYNAGEGAVARFGGIPPYRETQQYVQKALSAYHGRPWGGSGSISIRPQNGESILRGGFDRRASEPVPYVGATLAATTAAGRAGSR
jgi:soluble lytic murein transglycosylase-like protein